MRLEESHNYGIINYRFNSMKSLDVTTLSGLKKAPEIESLRLLVESIKDHAIFMLDVDGCVASWNTGAHLITGYTAEEITGQHFSQLYFQEDIENDHPEIELQLATEKEHYEGEGWLRRKGGLRFIAQININPIRDENRRLISFGLTIRDITEKRKHEASLYESQEQFRRAFDDALIGVTMIAPEGRFLKVNRALCEMTGYTETEMLAMNFQTITHRDDLPHNFSLFNQMLDNQRDTYLLEKRYIHKSGKIVHIRCHSSFVRDADGTPRYLFAHVENITEIKLRDAEREKLIDELQRTLARVKTLSGLIPICGWCKNVRSDKGYWQSVEEYIHSQTAAIFNHGICPDCQKKFREQIDRPEFNTLLPFV